MFLFFGRIDRLDYLAKNFLIVYSQISQNLPVQFDIVDFQDIDKTGVA